MSNYNNSMHNLLSLISKIHEKGNRLVTEELEKNGLIGLMPSHGDILFCLYQKNKMTMKEIADKIHRTKPTVTVLVDKLENLGYLKRENSKEDCRYKYIVLTPKGQDFEPLFKQISKILNDNLYKNLSNQEGKKLESLLKKIIE